VSDPSLFASRDFRLLLLGQTTAQLGTQVSGVAIPLLAVLTLDASAFEVGLVSASSTLAFALIGLPAGAWLDRMHRRPVLIASDAARAGLLATIPLAAVLGTLTIAHLVVVSLLAGFARVFFDVGYSSYLPTVIGKGKLLAGNSAMETLRASGQVIGPGLGGFLVSILGAAAVVLVQAVTFAVSAVSLLLIRTREGALPTLDVRPRLWPQIREGLRFVARNRILRATALASAASNFSFAVASSVNFIFMSRSLDLSATAIGLIIAAGSVTVMIAAAITPRMARAFGSARIIWLSLAVSGPFAILAPLAQPGWGVALLLVSIAAAEFGQIVYAITNVSLRQRLTPDRMLSRVSATMRFLIMGSFPAGALLGGILGELSIRGTLIFVAGIAILVPIPLYLALRGTRDVEEIPDWHTAAPADAGEPEDGRRPG
jgi:MFS family permease